MTKKDCNINGLQTIKSPENDIKTRLCATSEEEEVVVTDLVHCMCVLLWRDFFFCLQSTITC